MQVKGLQMDASEFAQTGFGDRPEVLYDIDFEWIKGNEEGVF
jgi:hypothetical protein